MWVDSKAHGSKLKFDGVQNRTSDEIFVLGSLINRGGSLADRVARRIRAAWKTLHVYSRVYRCWDTSAKAWMRLMCARVSLDTCPCTGAILQKVCAVRKNTHFVRKCCVGGPPSDGGRIHLRFVRNWSEIPKDVVLRSGRRSTLRSGGTTRLHCDSARPEPVEDRLGA